MTVVTASAPSHSQVVQGIKAIGDMTARLAKAQQRFEVQQLHGTSPSPHGTRPSPPALPMTWQVVWYSEVNGWMACRVVG